MPTYPPDVPHTIEYEEEGPDAYNVWCSLCEAGRSALNAMEAEDWAHEHDCPPAEDYSGDDPSYGSGDDGPTDAAYRAAMHDAGRGRLLS